MAPRSPASDGSFWPRAPWQLEPASIVGLGPGSPQTEEDLHSNLAGVGDHRGQIFVVALGSCVEEGLMARKSCLRVLAMVQRSAVGAGAVVPGNTRPFLRWKMGSRGGWGVSRRGKAPAPDGGEGS